MIRLKCVIYEKPCRYHPAALNNILSNITWKSKRPKKGSFCGPICHELLIKFIRHSSSSLLLTHIIRAHEILRGGDRLIIVEGLDLSTHSGEILLAIVVSRCGLRRRNSSNLNSTSLDGFFHFPTRIANKLTC